MREDASESTAFQTNAAVIEAQLKKKIETERFFASQVSMLASQLTSSASLLSEAGSSYERKCESLQNKNTRLGSHIEELEGKLGTITVALDSMADDQKDIVEVVTKHKNTRGGRAKVNYSSRRSRPTPPSSRLCSSRPLRRSSALSRR